MPGINFCFAIQLLQSARCYKFSNRNNNELLIINLAAVRADEFQIPVLRQAPNVDGNYRGTFKNYKCLTSIMKYLMKIYY